MTAVKNQRDGAAGCGRGSGYAAVLPALMVEEGATSYRKWVDSETGKDQEASLQGLQKECRWCPSQPPSLEFSEI